MEIYPVAAILAKDGQGVIGLELDIRYVLASSKDEALGKYLGYTTTDFPEHRMLVAPVAITPINDEVLAILGAPTTEEP